MGSMHPGVREGIRFFNTQKFFEAHEALEVVWLRSQGGEKTLLHGLIQVAAAFHHHTHGNPAGFRSLLEKGRAKLEGCRKVSVGVDLDDFRRQLRLWSAYVADRPPDRTRAPALPIIRAESRLDLGG